VMFVAGRLLFPLMPEVGQMVHVFSDMVDDAASGDMCPPVLSRLSDLSWFVV